MNLPKENQTTDEVNKLLPIYNEGSSVFHSAAEFCKLELSLLILNLAKWNLTTEEINKLLLATGNKGRIV